MLEMPPIQLYGVEAESSVVGDPRVDAAVRETSRVRICCGSIGIRHREHAKRRQIRP